MAKTQAKSKYVFRRGKDGFGVSADVAGNELARIREESCGVLNGEIVVAASRPEDAALHPAFEWDDFTAGENYRRIQARNLIRSVHVVSGDASESMPVYVNVGRGSDVDPGGYQPIDVVVQRPDLYARALHELRTHLEGAKKAVAELEGAAKGIPDADRDSLARIALAVQALQTASAVVQALH